MHFRGAMADDSTARLCEAAADGSTAEIARWLGSGANINRREKVAGRTFVNWRGKKIRSDSFVAGTALLCAVLGGHLDAVALLLQEGADINSTNEVRRAVVWGGASSPAPQLGYTPLTAAVSWYPRPEIARLLLAHGASATAASRVRAGRRGGCG